MNKIVTHVAVGVGALGLGGVLGYLIGKKRANQAADETIEQIQAYWRERINEIEGPAAVLYPGDHIVVNAPGAEKVQEALDQAAREMEAEAQPMAPDEIQYTQPDLVPAPVTVREPDVVLGTGDTGPIPAIVDAASNLEDDEDGEIEPDFPDAPVVVADDFTVEGQPAPVDARAFVEQFADRKVGDFGGVTFPGQTDDDDDDIPIKTVPDFIVVRNPNGPYVISIDDYMDPDTDPPFTKVEMRFFAGDRVVVDARDDQVPMSTVGEPNLERFGEGTTDPSQVYIRNERLAIDIELTREDGLYLHEVLGQDYPDKTPILKMREGDGN